MDTTDCDGNVRTTGDTVKPIKDLPVKGTKLTAKLGYPLKKIRITNDPEEIDCKVDEVSVTLKTCFVRKVLDKKGKKKR